MGTLSVYDAETGEKIIGGLDPEKYGKRTVFPIAGRWYLKVAQIYRTDDLPGGGYSEHIEVRVIETARVVAAVMDNA